ncbi:tissue factor pathway inhibitor isoform X4 [Petaurus breviceps papuanus]|uniref:tissue factor pathway inhibitor isoform X4 n=1 Tax=Petaurus breviceps papuanus TaxID=3040969 RepID=UPI0036DDE615
MMMKMKKGRMFVVVIFLLLSQAPWSLDANSDDEEGQEDILEMYLPPPKLLRSSCAYKADEGPCKAMLKRFFYNIYTQHCEEFVYGGCEGNENRFESLEDCQKQCVAEYPWKTTKTKFNQVDAVQADHGEKVAVPENNNSSTTKPTDVRKLFEFYGPSWCLTPADRGLCRASEKRFYFNSAIGKCRPFNYSGCGGNENNFTSKKSCLRTCKKGFSRQAKGGLIKTKRKRKKQPIRIIYEEIFVEKM